MSESHVLLLFFAGVIVGCAFGVMVCLDYYREVDAERTVARFVKLFPGKCMICSLHRYGVDHGMTRDPEPRAHECIDLDNSAKGKGYNG